MTFHILGIGVPSSLFNAYYRAATTLIILYGPSQFSWNFPAARSAMFSKTLLKARSPARNACCFICMLYRFVILCWYNAIRTVRDSRSSSVISKSLAMASVLACLGISI